MNIAIEDLQEHYSDLETDFSLFFKELINFTDNKINELSFLENI